MPRSVCFCIILYFQCEINPLSENQSYYFTGRIVLAKLAPLWYNTDMKASIKRKLAALTAVATVFALCGCNQEVAVVLDTPSPWHDGNGAYEKLVYSVAIYDGGSGEERKTLATGELVFELTETTGGAYETSTLDTRYTVTYTQDADEIERGLTDTVTSSVVFMTDSLHASSSQKTVSLAKRADKLDLSYTVTAEYMGENAHKATVTMTGYDEPTSTEISIPSGTFYDNEMMYYLARSTKLAANSAQSFRMVNLFDSQNTGKFTNYNMLASVKQDLAKIDVGDWVKDFGVEAVTDEETGAVSYPVSCYETGIYINDSKHGPEHYAFYSEKPFTSNGKAHNKIPVLMHYSEYSTSVLTRYTEYKLVSCSFDKAQD